MEVYTIGFTRKSAAEFFGTLERAGVRRVVDVRLNNVSQLAGFAKRHDLSFFLDRICGADYVMEPLLAPTQAMLDDYRKAGGSWDTYCERFLALMAERRIEEKIPPDLFQVPAALLCSEPTAERCHRRLVLEYLARQWDELQIVHL